MDQGDFVKSRYRYSIFSPHYTKRAASSTTKKGRVPIDTILKIGGWSMKTFGRFYDKEIVERKDDFALNILHNVKL